MENLLIFSDYMESVVPVEKDEVCSVEKGNVEEGVTEAGENLFYIAIGILALLVMM